MISVETLPSNLEQLSATQVTEIVESFINEGVKPQEISLGFCDDGKIAVAISGVLVGTILRTFDGESVDATFSPRNLN